MLNSAPFNTSTEGLKDEAPETEEVWRTWHLSWMWREASITRAASRYVMHRPRLPLRPLKGAGSEIEGLSNVAKTEDYCIGIHAFTQSSSPVISCFAQFHVERSIGLTGFQKCGFLSDSLRVCRQRSPTHVSLRVFRKQIVLAAFQPRQQLVIYKLSRCETMEIRSVNYTKKAKAPHSSAMLWIPPSPSLKSLVVHLSQGELEKSGSSGSKLIV